MTRYKVLTPHVGSQSAVNSMMFFCLQALSLRAIKYKTNLLPDCVAPAER